MKKRITAIIAVMMMVVSVAACTPTESSTTAAATTAAATTAAAANVEMQKMSVEDAAANIGKEGYTFIDLRKTADFNVSTVKSAVAADISAAVEGDAAAAVAPLTAVTKDNTDTLVLICYTGNKYAQLATNTLKEMGYDMSKVYTLDGGFKAFSAAKADLVATK